MSSYEEDAREREKRVCEHAGEIIELLHALHEVLAIGEDFRVLESFASEIGDLLTEIDP